MKKSYIKILVMSFFVTAFVIPQAFGAMRATGPAPGTAPTAAEAKDGKPAEKKKLTSADFYGFAFALENVSGFHFDTNLEMNVVPDIWPTDAVKGSDGVVRYVSGDKDMFVELSSREVNGLDIITLDKRKDRSTLTIFKDQKPESFTVVDPKGIYTATQGFCEILKTQTDSKSFSAMANTARTCRDFYARPGLDSAMKDEVQKHLDTHRRNLSLMKDSVAKPLVLAGEAAQKDPTKRWSNFWGLLPKSSSKLPQPRAVLSKVPTGDESDDRNVLYELSVACDRLWKSKSDGIGRPTRTNRSASGAVTQ